MNNGMTKSEMAEFKRIQAASRAMRTPDDMRAVKAMTADWVRSAPNPTAKMRRKNMSRAVKGAYSWF